MGKQGAPLDKAQAQEGATPRQVMPTPRQVMRNQEQSVPRNEADTLTTSPQAVFHSPLTRREATTGRQLTRGSEPDSSLFSSMAWW